MSPVIGRLAPTPSGELHLGNVCAFAAAWLAVRKAGGRLLLRMEDVDAVRARQEIEDGIRRDLDWLGLHWDEETERQSTRDYRPTLKVLQDHTYHCGCTRKLLKSLQGEHPLSCRQAGHETGPLRLALPTQEVRFDDQVFGPQVLGLDPSQDPILVRRDGLSTYLLAVVTDDIADGVTQVVRGADILPFTAIQQYMWRLLGHTEPAWAHTPVILGPDGRKLSKSHGSEAVASLRERGYRPSDIWSQVLPWLGLPSASYPAEVVDLFDWRRIPRGPIQVAPR